MSESAFGINHGDEISKVGIPKMKMNPLGQMKSAFKGVGAKAGAGMQRAGTGMQRMGSPGQHSASPGRIAGASQSFGRGASKLGAKMSANPGVTGAAIGGGLAGGAALGNGQRNKRPGMR